MHITWFGHSAFCIEQADAKILIDPFLSGNPSWGKGWEDAAQGVTHVALTHGHDDHLGDTLAICRATGAQLIANFEICAYLSGLGLPEIQQNPGNVGGTLPCGAFSVTFVKAEHSSSSQTGNGMNIYLGNPAGLVFHIEGAPTVLAMGDTDIFGDMALIEELHQPEIGLVPIGDRFTMGAAVAALACQRYFNFETVIPCHYGTFGVLAADASQFAAAMAGQRTKVIVPQIGVAEAF
jgi:L-ascorbate metabolism protein UlaG (beta-lactamase superfamily)